jgi:hypothetical protein
MTLIIERIARMRAWIRDFGSQKQPIFIEDLTAILDEINRLREAELQSTDDWTRDPETGRSNSSQKYIETVKIVERLIRDEAHLLIAGRADSTAGLIVSQLAHKYGFAPRKEQPCT